MSDPSPSLRFTTRDLPCAARLTLAAFLISVGIGYFSALIQLHFQHAQAGSAMPTPDDAVRIFHGHTGEAPKSPLVRLIEAPETGRFNGTGQMSIAFTIKSDRWKSAIKAKATQLFGKKGKPGEEELKKAEEVLRKERDAERIAVVAWLTTGFSRESFEQDHFSLPNEMKSLPLTSEFVVKEGDDVTLKIKSLWDARCVRCHAKDGEDANAVKYPLEKFDQLAAYNKVETATAMSLTKLAQTTHVHLLGFSMLYGLTGLILALSPLPGIIRLPLAPLPLIAQVLDISLWWLARMDAPEGPLFARLIPITGAIVGASLGLQILLSLFTLFGWSGRTILILLMLVTGYGGYVAKEKVIDPYLLSQQGKNVSHP